MIVYLAHPVAPTAFDLAEKREELSGWAESLIVDSCVADNLSAARIWLRWLVTHTDWAICAPWMPYVETLNDATSSHRERGLRDDCRMAARCDAVLLCGGRVSSGMGMERDAAHRAGKAIVSLIDLGPLPPSTEWMVGMRLGADPGALLQRRMREALGG